MAFVEMGPVSNSLMRLVMNRFKPQKGEPLFTRDTPRLVGVGGPSAPIETTPLNRSEAQERDTLRSLRDALHSQPRD